MVGGCFVVAAAVAYYRSRDVLLVDRGEGYTIRARIRARSSY